MELLRIVIDKVCLEEAAAKGDYEYLQVFVNHYLDALGGELTANNMGMLRGEQISLVAYSIFRNEMLEGGFVQLIHNGYGSFFFNNPFAKAMRLMGADDFARLLNKAKRLYVKHKDTIMPDCSYEEFMALYEKFPAFDKLDDAFVEMEEGVTATLARYVNQHLKLFAELGKD